MIIQILAPTVLAVVGVDNSLKMLVSVETACHWIQHKVELYS